MKKTLSIILLSQLLIMACSSPHERVLDLDFDTIKDIQPTNDTEEVIQYEVCDLSNYMSLELNTVDPVPFRVKRDIDGYIDALKENDSRTVSQYNSLLEAALKCK